MALIISYRNNVVDPSLLSTDSIEPGQGCIPRNKGQAPQGKDLCWVRGKAEDGQMGKLDCL